jgi:hypothetical protein
MSTIHRPGVLGAAARTTVRASALVAGLALIAVIPSLGASAASLPSPPFGQCPAIGAAPSCEILLVVNSGETVSVLGDSSVGPFDGSDDTLVGIVNDSSKAVTAVTVSGPGSGLSLFDGDGICSGSYGTWNGSSGCPYGPTGYEGPKTSFVTSPSLPDSAEVDFTGGLAPAGTAYFSLEGALTSAELTAREGPLTGRYVALGDSYSSGEGDPPFITGTNTTANECHRATQAYGPQVQADQKIPDTEFIFQACSGAVMADFVANLLGDSGQYTDGAQLDAIAPAGVPSTSTTLVTLSIGGNDAGFPFILKACVTGTGSSGSPSNCHDSIKSHLAAGTSLLASGGTILLDTKDNSFTSCGSVCVKFWSFVDKEDPGAQYQVVTVPSLSGLYTEIHQRAPQAKIRVLLYPHLFPASPPATCTVGSYTLTVRSFHHTFDYTLGKAEMTAMNSAGDTLDATITRAVATAKTQGIDIQTVDARPDFEAHEICGSSPWLNALVLNGKDPSPFSFHPNSSGQDDFAKLFEGSL